MAVTNSSALKRAAKPRGTACPDDLHFLLPPPITYFVNLITGFVDRFIPANHSAGRNIKLPICREMDSQGKATMKHIKAVLSDAVFARWRRRAIRRKSLSKAESIEMEKIIVDFVVVCLKSNSENFRRPLTFHRRTFSNRDGFQDGTLSKICSKIDTLSDRVCHACARKIRNAFELYNFIYSSLQKEKATEVSGDLSRCKRLLPTTASSPDRSPQARKGHKASRENSASKKSSYLHQARLRITSLRTRERNSGNHT